MIKIMGYASNRGITFVSKRYIVKMRRNKDGSHRQTLRKRKSMGFLKKYLPQSHFPIRLNYVILTAALLLFLMEWTGVYSIDISNDLTAAPWVLLSLDVMSAVFLACLLGYLLLGVLFRFNRTIRYHGAEHKALHAFQDGCLNFEGAKVASRVSRRCGTELFVLVVPLYALASLLTDNEFIGFLLALSLGVQLFNLRKGDRIPVISLLFKLGYFLQRNFLTREPDDEQLEAAVASVILLVETELDLPVRGAENG